MDPNHASKVNITYIPNDFVFSILSKLPVKSLRRFSCVRKSWTRLLENHNFINIFCKNLYSGSHSLDDDICVILNQVVLDPFHCTFYLLSGDKFENKVKLDLPPPFHIQHNRVSVIRILGSATNGIICIYNCDNHTIAVLWNPATQEVMVIPPSLAEFKREFITKITLHGFGYDHVRDDYSVIQHVCYTKFKEHRLDNVIPHPFWEIYSLKNSCWRKIDIDMPTRNWIYNSDLYLNGMCHWWGKNNNLVSFNLCKEEHFITPSPFEDVHDTLDIHLIALNGHVAMISYSKKAISFQISILGEFGVKESWIRLFYFRCLSCIEQSIGAGEKGNIFFTRKDGQLVCFDLTTGMVENVGLKGEILWSQTVIYKKNLQLIGAIDK
ncbi:putative F-box domain-containing protein [Medicago truncatula]|uniref:Putative F-box domain-containing protein n=1 Tax=Medicago truncatula TaxID=3880 RepID=A0A396GJ86_MEDTR|nr:F-box protein At1g11270 [Medicago truncatula]RHN41060.1 putative F-box domain-containing protein [Medicago truncatula]